MLNTTTLYKFIAASVITSSLSACHDESYHHSDHHDSHYYESPEIHTLEVVDSAGHSNIVYPYNTPIIDPYQDHGYFEVWWDVSSYDDYSATLYINDHNSLLGAIELERTQCGATEGCDYEGFMYCSYSHYDTVSCSGSAYQSPETNIAELIYAHPERLYLVLEVCDNYSGYCDSKSELAVFR